MMFTFLKRRLEMNIKKGIAVVGVLILWCSLCSAALAQETEDEADKPYVKASLAFFSQYIWRGYELSQDSLVIFPSMTIGYKGFDVNMWGDYDTDYNTTGETTWWETDLVITYSNSMPGLDKLGYTLGLIKYDVDGGDNAEIFAILSLDSFLKPTVSAWREIEIGEQYYFNFSVSHGWAMPCEASLDVGGWISYMHRPERSSANHYSALHDGNVWVSYTMPLNEYFSLTPSLSYSFPLSNSAEDEIEDTSFDGDDDKFLYGGVTLNVAF